MSKIKYYHLYADAYDANGEKHVVTVVGKLLQYYKHVPIETNVPVEVRPGKTINGKLTVNKRVIERVLTVGVSICHPTDEFDEERGVCVAKRRIENGQNSGIVKTNSVTMLTEDLVYAELLGKLSYIVNNIEKYIGEEEPIDKENDKRRLDDEDNDSIEEDNDTTYEIYSDLDDDEQIG